MKEQSQHQFQNEKLEPQIQWEVLDKSPTNTTTPKPRYKHQTFIYQQNTLYVYGGTTIPSNEVFDDPLDIYRFSFTSKEWQKVRLKCNSKDFEVVSGHCGALNGNRWFMFGGTNNDFRCNNYLWRLNLQTFEMNKLQNRGQIPSARDSASLFCIDKNCLLLYGGVNVNNVQIYNNFHFYNIETRHWTKCEGPYQYQAYSRFDPALVQVNNKLYMFGGTYRNRQNQQLYLNDFYQIDISVTTRGLPCKIGINRLISDVMPEARSGHALADLGDGYILLLGGQNSQTKMKDGIKFDDATVVSNAWIYCIEFNIWRKISVKNSNRFKFRSQFTLSNIQKNKFVLFGGIHNYNSVSNELLQINILNYHIRSLPKISNCLKCYQKQRITLKDHFISAQIIQDITQSIPFPFAAVGFLIDNGFNHGATFINIFYHDQIGRQKIKALRVEDNAKLLWSDEQFFSSMASFSASPSFLPSSTDKKIKTAFHKQNLRLEYGSNCKMSSLRLGSGFLHISYSQNGQLVRVCLFKKEADQYKNNRYVLITYTYSVITKQCTTSEMNEARKYVQERYGELIEDALSQYNVKNTLFILQPKIQNPSASQEQQMELKVNFANNDIINGLYSNYTTLQKAGYYISECIDVSLKAYITCLYLKNQTTLIALSVRNTDPISIPTQAYLQKVDKLCKYKNVLQINNLIEFQFKIVELYYLYDLKRKLNYFNNGLLIYHKNRLITRYKYPLGELIPRKIYKMEGNCNLIRMFGFIELPDHVPVNIFKTNVIHPLLTEKLFSRLKFMNKMFKKELQKMVTENNYKRVAPTKLSNEEKEQDIKDNPQFKAETETGKEKHRKSSQKERSRRGNSNLQTKPGSQIENEQPKMTTEYKKDEMLERTKVGLSQIPSEIVQNKVSLQEKVIEMRQVQIEINENEMRNQQASDSSSSSEERQYQQMVEEQGVEIRQFGIDEENQHIQQGAQQNQDQMKQKMNGKIQQEKGNNASIENGHNGPREIEEQLSGDSKKHSKEEYRNSARIQKAAKQNSQKQIEGDPSVF